MRYIVLAILGATALSASAATYSTSFDGFTAGDINGQDGWSAQLQWNTDGAGNLVNGDSNNGAFVRAHNQSVLASTTVGEVATISTTFTLGTYDGAAGNLADFREGVLLHTLSHQQGISNFSTGLGIGLYIDDDSGGQNLELRSAGDGITIDSGSTAAFIGDAGTLATGIWTFDVSFTRTDADSYDVFATIDNDSDGNAPTTLSFSATVAADLATDSDGGGILGGIQALPGAGTANNHPSPVYADLTISDFSFTVIPEPSAGLLALTALFGFLRRRR